MNTSNHSRFLSAVLSIVFVSVPVIAFAMHPANTYIEHGTGKTDIQNPINTQIQDLLAQIKVLQEKIRSLTASDNQPIQTTFTPSIIESGDAGTSNEIEIEKANLAEREKYRDYSNGGTICQGFYRNLSVGSRGDDVLQLQQILAGNGFLQSNSITGYFGTQTKTALGLWQLSSGIAQAGAFGPKSRAFLKQNCDDGWMGGGTIIPDIPDKPPQYFCTQDAVQCPDGSYVGRTGPKCEAVCPTTTTKCTPRPACMDTYPYCELYPSNVCPPIQ